MTASDPKQPLGAKELVITEPFSKLVLETWFHANEAFLSPFVKRKFFAVGKPFKDTRSGELQLLVGGVTVCISACDAGNTLQIAYNGAEAGELPAIEVKGYASTKELLSRLDSLLVQLTGMCD